MRATKSLIQMMIALGAVILAAFFFGNEGCRQEEEKEYYAEAIVLWGGTISADFYEEVMYLDIGPYPVGNAITAPFPVGFYPFGFLPAEGFRRTVKPEAETETETETETELRVEVMKTSLR